MPDGMSLEQWRAKKAQAKPSGGMSLDQWRAAKSASVAPPAPPAPNFVRMGGGGFNPSAAQFQNVPKRPNWLRDSPMVGPTVRMGEVIYHGIADPIAGAIDAASANYERDWRAEEFRKNHPELANQPSMSAPSSAADFAGIVGKGTFGTTMGVAQVAEPWMLPLVASQAAAQKQAEDEATMQGAHPALGVAAAPAKALEWWATENAAPFAEKAGVVAHDITGSPTVAKGVEGVTDFAANMIPFEAAGLGRRAVTSIGKPARPTMPPLERVPVPEQIPGTPSGRLSAARPAPVAEPVAPAMRPVPPNVTGTTGIRAASPEMAAELRASNVPLETPAIPAPAPVVETVPGRLRTSKPAPIDAPAGPVAEPQLSPGEAALLAERKFGVNRLRKRAVAEPAPEPVPPQVEAPAPVPAPEPVKPAPVAEVAPTPRPIPDADAPNVATMQRRSFNEGVRAEKGKPGVETFPADDYGFTEAVFRDENGVVRGVASYSSATDTHKANINVAVDPAFQRKGIASSLYRALEESGVPVSDVSGTMGMTESGAAFVKGRKRVAPAVEAKPASPELPPPAEPAPAPKVEAPAPASVPEIPETSAPSPANSQATLESSAPAIETDRSLSVAAREEQYEGMRRDIRDALDQEMDRRLVRGTPSERAERARALEEPKFKKMVDDAIAFRDQGKAAQDPPPPQRDVAKSSVSETLRGATTVRDASRLLSESEHVHPKLRELNKWLDEYAPDGGDAPVSLRGRPLVRGDGGAVLRARHLGAFDPKSGEVRVFLDTISERAERVASRSGKYDATQSAHNYAARVLAHERVHSLTVDVLHGADPRFAETRARASNLYDQYKSEAGRLGEKIDRYATNPEEFIAEALSNPDLQAQLARMKHPSGGTVWDKVVDVVHDLMRRMGMSVERTLLNDTLSTGIEAIQRQREGRAPKPVVDTSAPATSLQRAFIDRFVQATREGKTEDAAAEYRAMPPAERTKVHETLVADGLWKRGDGFSLPAIKAHADRVVAAEKAAAAPEAPAPGKLRGKKAVAEAKPEAIEGHVSTTSETDMGTGGEWRRDVRVRQLTRDEYLDYLNRRLITDAEARELLGVHRPWVMETRSTKTTPEGVSNVGEWEHFDTGRSKADLFGEKDNFKIAQSRSGGGRWTEDVQVVDPEVKAWVERGTKAQAAERRLGEIEKEIERGPPNQFRRDHLNDLYRNALNKLGDNPTQEQVAALQSKYLKRHEKDIAKWKAEDDAWKSRLADEKASLEAAPAPAKPYGVNKGKLRRGGKQSGEIVNPIAASEGVYDAADAAGGKLLRSAASAVRENVPGVDKVVTAAEGIRDKWFKSDAANVGPEYLAAKGERRGVEGLGVEHAGRAVKAVDKALRKASPEDVEGVYRYMNGESDALPASLAHRKALFDAVSSEIKSLGSQLVERGLMSQEAFDQYVRYLPRLYETKGKLFGGGSDAPRIRESFLREDAPGFKFKAGDYAIIEETARKHGGYAFTEKHGTSAVKFPTVEARDAAYAEVSEALRGQKSRLNQQATGEIRKGEVGQAKMLHRDSLETPSASRMIEKFDAIKPEVLKELGEITDPRAPIQQAIQNAHAKIAADTFFKAVAEGSDAKGPWAVELPRDGYTHIDAQWAGKLRGKYVRNDILPDIQGDFNADKAGFARGWINQWKANKTVWSPRTAARQWFGNPFFMHLAGVDPMNPANWSAIKKAATALHPDSPLRRELVREGVIGPHDFAHIELPTDRAPNMAYRLGQAAANPLMLFRFGRNAQMRMGKVYGSADLLARASIYFRNKELGLSERNSSAEVRKWTPNYDEVGRATKLLKNSVIGSPFATYSHETLRIVGQALKDHPVRLGTGLLTLAAVQKAFDMAGADEVTEDERKAIEQQRGSQELIIGRDSEGRPLTFGAQYINPIGSLAPKASRLGDDALTNAATYVGDVTGVAQSPLVDTLATMSRGEDRYGRKTAPRAATGYERVMGALEAYGRQVAPGLTPGLGGNYAQVDAAAKGEQLSDRIPKQTLQQAIVSAILGIDVRPFDVGLEKKNLSKQMEGRISSIESDRNAALRESKGKDKGAAPTAVEKLKDTVQDFRARSGVLRKASPPKKDTLPSPQEKP